MAFILATGQTILEEFCVLLTYPFVVLQHILASQDGPGVSFIFLFSRSRIILVPFIGEKIFRYQYECLLCSLQKKINQS